MHIPGGRPVFAPTPARAVMAAVLLGLLVVGVILCRSSGIVTPAFVIWLAALWLVAAFCLFFRYTPPKWAHRLQVITATLLCAVATLCMLETFNRNTVSAMRAGALLLGLLLILALYLLLFALIGRLSTAIVAASSVLLAFGLVDFFVMLFRGTPFVLPGDIYAIGTAASVAGSYHLRLDPVFFPAILQYLCVYVIAGKASFAAKGKKRLWTLVGGVVVSGAVLFGVCAQPTLDALGVTPNRYDQDASLRQNGMLMYTVSEMVHARAAMPAGYGDEALDALQAAYPSDEAPAPVSAPTPQRPNIVLVLSESWSDLHRHANLETDKPVTPFLDSFRMREDVVAGELLVPVFGGATVCTEFESLTGNSVAFSLSSAAYFQHVSKGASPSIASTLNSAGYASTAIHPFLATGWGRDKAYPNMGFEHFITLEDMDDVQTLRYYANDDTSFGVIEQTLEDTAGPGFVYCITMQNHGNYNYEGYTPQLKLTNQNEELPLTQQYLSLLHDSDAAFERFIGYIDALDEPTIVMMYGDHLPMLGDEYNRFATPIERQYRHRTPFVLYANYEGAFTEYADTLRGGVMTTSYITPCLLQSAGLPQTGYYKFLLDLKERYPAFSLSWDTKGDEAFGGSVHPGDAMVPQYRILQYNNIFGHENRRDELFYLQ